jgi:hypothetical protein
MSTITNVPITPDMYAQRQIRVLVMKEEVDRDSRRADQA